MYAIVDIAGEQVKVQKDDQIVTNRLEGEVGSQIELEHVLLLQADDGTKVGTPYVEGAKVTATILEHGKGKKVIVFKKKRRKKYRVKRGHRQLETKLKIDDIVVS